MAAAICSAVFPLVAVFACYVAGRELARAFTYARALLAYGRALEAMERD